MGLPGAALAPSGYREGVADFVNLHRSHEIVWTVSEVISALIDAGLSLRVFKEYPYTNGCKMVPDMVEKEGCRFYPPESQPTIPMMYGLVAERAIIGAEGMEP